MGGQCISSLKLNCGVNWTEKEAQENHRCCNDDNNFLGCYSMGSSSRNVTRACACRIRRAHTNMHHCCLWSGDHTACSTLIGLHPTHSAEQLQRLHLQCYLNQFGCGCMSKFHMASVANRMPAAHTAYVSLGSPAFAAAGLASAFCKRNMNLGCAYPALENHQPSRGTPYSLHPHII